jgi:Mg-chelatase subunit ChlD
MTVRAILITDGSGSMSRLADDVRGGHNAYLDQVAASALDSGEEVRITLAVFNTNVRIIDADVPVTMATRLDESNYVPMGGTALLDATGRTLQTFRTSVTVKPGDKTFVFIQTDGHENASTEFTKAAVAEAIAELEAQGWAFTFSGTGPGDWAEGGRSVGLAANSVTYNTATKGGIAVAYAGRAETVSTFLRSDTATRSTYTSATVAAQIQDTIDQAGEGDTSS